MSLLCATTLICLYHYVTSMEQVCVCVCVWGGGYLCFHRSLEWQTYREILKQVSSLRILWSWAVKGHLYIGGHEKNIQLVRYLSLLIRPVQSHSLSKTLDHLLRRPRGRRGRDGILIIGTTDISQMHPPFLAL